METEIVKTLKYFDHFVYPPTFDEVWIFLGKSSSKEKLKRYLDKMVENGDVVVECIGGNRYTLQVSEEILKKYKRRYNHSIKLIEKSLFVLNNLKIISTIKYLGFSGSLAMKNASTKSDIDLFVITESGSVWMTRFIILVHKHIISLLNINIGRKFCFNLFFAEDGLTLRKTKQNEYIAHELLQLKTVFDKGSYLQKLQLENIWLTKFFPNVQIKVTDVDAIGSSLRHSKAMIIIEKIVRYIQVWWLRRKKLKFVEFGAQLWLIQDDYERKILGRVGRKH